MKILEHLSRRSTPFIITSGLMLVLLLGFVDHFTGPDLSAEIIYFVPVLLVSWFAGKRGGYIVSAVSAGAGFLADASTKPASLSSAVPYWNAAVEMAVFLTVVHLTATVEHLRQEEEGNRAAVLTRADDLKTALLQAVSHDIRTPLASMKTSVTSLLDTSVAWDKATRCALLQGIDEECDRLNHLVSNLLDVSRIEGGVVHLERDWYSIQEVVHTVLRRLRPTLADHPVEVDVPENLPLLLLDFTRVDQVVTNLLENAARHTPAGTPILISARMGHAVTGGPKGRRAASGGTTQAAASTSFIEVTVTDKGPGVAPQDLARLFETFHITGSGPWPHGTGLGLSIARGMVQAHNGQISAQSWPGHGFSVTFTLPCAPIEQTNAVRDAATAASPDLPLDAPAYGYATQIVGMNPSSYTTTAGRRAVDGA